MKIQVYGSGCAKCRELTANAAAAAERLGLDVSIEKVTDINEMITAGVMITPALAVGGRVVSAGAVPTVEQIVAMLT